MLFQSAEEGGIDPAKGVRVAAVPKFPDVGTRCERPISGADHHQGADVIAAFEVVQNRVQLGDHRGVDGVPGLRPVQGDARDGVVIRGRRLVLKRGVVHEEVQSNLGLSGAAGADLFRRALDLAHVVDLDPLIVA